MKANELLSSRRTWDSAAIIAAASHELFDVLVGDPVRIASSSLTYEDGSLLRSAGWEMTTPTGAI